MGEHNDKCWMEPEHHLCAVRKVLQLTETIAEVSKAMDQNYSSAYDLGRQLEAARKRIAELEAARGI